MKCMYKIHKVFINYVLELLKNIYLPHKASGLYPMEKPLYNKAKSPAKHNLIIHFLITLDNYTEKLKTLKA